MVPDIGQKISALEKADPHIHFEGTVGPRLLERLAKHRRVDLGEPTWFSEIKISPPKKHLLSEAFRGTFRDFIELYLKISSSIQEPEDFALVAEHYGLAAKSEHIRAIEMYITPSTFFTLGVSEHTFRSGLLLAEKTLQAFGIRTNWIFDVVRNGASDGRETLELAEKFRSQGVSIRAFGLAGLEAGYPATRFAPVLEEAKAKGFRLYVHAGETAGAESIWQTIDCCEPDRIGHGVRAIEDPKLLEALKKRRITLEVCPWSNIALGIYSAEDHPLGRLIELGLDVVLASDDPGIFGKSLSENYQFAYDQGVSFETLQQIAARSVELCS